MGAGAAYKSRKGPSQEQRWQRWTIGSIVGVAVAVLLYGLAGLAAERYVREQLRAGATALCSEVDRNRAPEIVVNLFRQSVSITGLTLVPMTGCPSSSLKIHGRLDSAQFTGLSLLGLLFRDRVEMDHLRLCLSGAIAALAHDSLRVAMDGPMGRNPDVWSVAIGSFSVVMHSSSVINQAGDTIICHDPGVSMSGKDLRFIIGQEDAHASFGVQGLLLSTDSLVGRMASGYAWSVRNFRIDQALGTLHLLRTRIGPSLGVEAFSATLPSETDVIEARLDTMLFDGFELVKAFTQKVYSFRRMQLTSGSVLVLRDKVAADGKDHEKPLLSHLIRSFPLGSGADSIIVHGLDVEYRERIDVQRGYAVIPFTEIEAVITGARHIANDTSGLIVRAGAVAFGAASISFLLRARIADTTDRFVIEASIGPMPFSALNSATGPLVDIRATEGRIDTVTYRMIADDHLASGAVRMRHRGLQLASGGRKSQQAGYRIESAILNALVRSTSHNKIDDARDGRFTFERRRDRAIFNYLWSGLREGVKAELLPGALAN